MSELTAEPVVVADPAAVVVPEPVVAEPVPSIYGDLEVKFPEGFDTTLSNEPSLKAFVDKDSGEVNYSNLMKSYVHTKKQMGVDKVVLPREDATAEELDAFHAKLGYKTDEAEYLVERPEDGTLSEEMVADAKKFARDHRLPLKTAQAMVGFLNEKSTTSQSTSDAAQVAQIETGLSELKTEWGQAYDQNVSMAQRVLQEVVKDEALIQTFADPRIGSNPGVIKALNAIGQGLFKEDGFAGTSTPAGAMAPAEAGVAINAIQADRTHPYHNKGDARHHDAVAEMSKLFNYKNNVR